MFPPIPLIAVDPFDDYSREILREFDFGTDKKTPIVAKDVIGLLVG